MILIYLKRYLKSEGFEEEAKQKEKETFRGESKEIFLPAIKFGGLDGTKGYGKKVMRKV